MLPKRKSPLLSLALQRLGLLNHPYRDEHGFLYLNGEAPQVDTLSEARLKLHVINDDRPDEKPEVLEAPVEQFGNVIVRQKGVYGGPLKPGLIELIADYMIYSPFFPKANYTIRCEALLPDDRILFSFEGPMDLTKTGTDA